jgi:hypothetical protein
MPHHEFVHHSTERASRFVAFIDECGDHSWTHINPEVPLFVLSTILVERDHYAHEIGPPHSPVPFDARPDSGAARSAR